MLLCRRRQLSALLETLHAQGTETRPDDIGNEDADEEEAEQRIAGSVGKWCN